MTSDEVMELGDVGLAEAIAHRVMGWKRHDDYLWLEGDWRYRYTYRGGLKNMNGWMEPIHKFDPANEWNHTLEVMRAGNWMQKFALSRFQDGWGLWSWGPTGISIGPVIKVPRPDQLPKLICWGSLLD